MSSSKEVAHLYHRLNQLKMVANEQDMNGLLYSLCAVNMAEAAGLKMPAETLIEIYLTAALRVKHTYPRYMQFFCRYYVSKAKYELTTTMSNISAKFKWEFTPYGYRFFVTHPVNYDFLMYEGSLFSTLDTKLDPLAHVMRTYRQHLLKRALQALVGSGEHQKYDSQDENQQSRGNTNLISSCTGTQVCDVLCYTQLLMESMGVDLDFTKSSSQSPGCSQDRLTHWWMNLINVSAFWLLGEFEKAQELYDGVEMMPNQLRTGSDKLPMALLFAFRAKRGVL